jgi:hypothetical protein
LPYKNARNFSINGIACMSASDKEHQSLSGDGIFVQSLASEDIAYSKGVSVPVKGTTRNLSPT